MNAIAHKAWFTVDAEFIVKFARDQVLSKDWRGALRTLTVSLSPPLSLDTAVDILAGRATLARTPDYSLEVVPQPQDCPDLKRYLSTAHWQQAGLLERDGEFYQPYAEIVGFTLADEQGVLERLRDQQDWTSCVGYREARARHYAERPFDDIVCFDAGDNPVLMKRVQGPGIWVRTFTSAQEALTDFLTARPSGLEQRGGGPHSVSARSVHFYLEAVLAGVLVGDDDILPDDEQALLETLMQMRAEFDNGERGDSESAFEDDARSVYWCARVNRAAETMGGFIDIEAKSESFHDDCETTVYRVARNPFLLWARQYGYKPGNLPEWTRVCPGGLKMLGDNPMHTDWFVSSGVPLRAAYNHEHPLNKAAWRLAYKWQTGEGLTCMKLAGRGRVTGTVTFPRANEGVQPGSIAVVSHAGPEYELALMTACKGESGAVIAEVGGKLAHLAIVSRELGARLVMVEDALTKFREGELVTVDLDTGEVVLHSRGEHVLD